MGSEQRKALVDELSVLSTHAAKTMTPEGGRTAILALGLAADFIRAGKDPEDMLRSLRTYVQRGER